MLLALGRCVISRRLPPLRCAGGGSGVRLISHVTARDKMVAQATRVLRISRTGVPREHGLIL